MKTSSVLFLFFQLVLAASCVPQGSDEAARFRRIPPISGTVSFAQVRELILVPQCLSCHGWVRAEAQVLSRVRPGDPAGSRLYSELVSGRMPRGSARLSQEQLDLVAAWIRTLADSVPPPPTPIELAPTFAALKVHLLERSCTMCHHAEARRLPSFETLEEVRARADDILYYLEFGEADGSPMPPLDRDGVPRAPVPGPAVVAAFREWVTRGTPGH